MPPPYILSPGCSVTPGLPGFGPTGVPNVWRARVDATPPWAPVDWPVGPIFIADCEVIPIATYKLRTYQAPGGDVIYFRFST